VIDRRTLLAALPAAALAAHAGAAPPSAADLKGDIAILREVLLSLHPGLYRYSSPRGIDAGIARLEAEFVSAPDLERRYLALSRFLATIKCGHSYANFFNQKKAVASALFERPTRLPFAFRWIGGEMVATQLQSSALPFMPGTIITRINGVRPREMLAALMPYARADGSNDAKRRALLSVTGEDSLEYFDVFQGLLFPPGPRGFDLDIVENGKHRQVTMPAISLSVRRQFASPQPRNDTAVWQWEMKRDIAVLRMDTWSMYNSNWDWQSWLSARLDSLRGAKGLIVDLRRNEGGNDCGDMILARFAGKDIIRPKAKRLVRYRQIPKALNPYLDTWDDSFRDWGAEAVDFDDRYFKLTRYDDGQVLAAKSPHIDVAMIVLTSAANSSATFQFAQLARAGGLGTLMGETTGGNRRGINGGAFFFVRLPASGLEFDLPLIGFFPETREPDAGLVPDIRITETAQDISFGRDPTMEAALARLA
jgi:Peptidase family S41